MEVDIIGNGREPQVVVRQVGKGRWNVCHPEWRIGKRFFSAEKWRNKI
jgi:hypothetical protein